MTKQSTSTRLGAATVVLGGLVVAGGALAATEVVHRSETPRPAEQRPEPKRVQLVLEGTNGVPMHVTGVRDGHTHLFDTDAVATFSHEEVVQVGEVADFEITAAVDHVERRTTVKCTIKVDGRPVDTRPLVVRVGYAGSVRCHKTVYN